LLCNFGGRGPECLRVFHSGTFLRRVFHTGIAQGTGCSRSFIKIGGGGVFHSGLVCHRRGNRLFFTWNVNRFLRFGTRIQVDFAGAGAASPTGIASTRFR